MLRRMVCWLDGSAACLCEGREVVPEKLAGDVMIGWFCCWIKGLNLNLILVNFDSWDNKVVLI